MTDSEEDEIKKTSKTLHNMCVYSNIFYLIAGLIGLIFLKGSLKLIGVGIIIVSIISTLHHTNNNFIFSQKTLSKLDIICANTLMIISSIILYYLFGKTKSKSNLDYILVFITTILSICSIIMFYLSEKENKEWDTIHNKGVGPVLQDINQNKQINESIIFLSYHTTWHILGSISMIFGIVLIYNLQNK